MREVVGEVRSEGLQRWRGVAGTIPIVQQVKNSSKFTKRAGKGPRGCLQSVTKCECFRTWGAAANGVCVSPLSTRMSDSRPQRRRRRRIAWQVQRGELEMRSRGHGS